MLNTIISFIKSFFLSPTPIVSAVVPVVKVLAIQGVATPKLVESVQLKKPAKDVDTNYVSPFMRAVSPLLNAVRENTQRFSCKDLQCFVEYIGLMDDRAFRDFTQGILEQFGYKTERECNNNSDFFIEREGTRTLVRTQANARSLINVMVRSIGLSQCQLLSDDAKEISADFGIMISAGKINQPAIKFCRKNKLFGLAGYDLLRIAVKAGLVNFDQVNPCDAAKAA
jgi:hypothetical protein